MGAGGGGIPTPMQKEEKDKRGYRHLDGQVELCHPIGRSLVRGVGTCQGFQHVLHDHPSRSQRHMPRR